MNRMIQAAREGKIAALFELLRVKRANPGKAAVAKKDCPKWRTLVKAGYAREGKTHIHLVSFQKRGLTVKIEAGWLDHDPNTIAFAIIQAHWLRCISLTGRTRQARKRNLRLVANESCGGVRLETMAALFGKTKQWASWMRKKVEKAGWASYHRRWVKCSEAEAFVCRAVGEGGRVSRDGLREVVSLARLNRHFLFRWSYTMKKEGPL